MSSKQPLLFLVALTTAFLVACSSSNDTPAPPAPPVAEPPPEPTYLDIALPTVELPPGEGDIALLSTFFSLEDVGFVQEEFFLSGDCYLFYQSE